MVNIVFHGVGAAFESDSDVEANEGVHNELFNGAHQQIHQSCFGGWFPKHSRDKSSLSKKLIKSFRAVTKIKRREKSYSEKMEKFLSEMAREKPIRFSSKQLKSFTLNFSSCIGSGGFAKVYKGEIPNGVAVAVKLLKDSSCEAVEELFIAEVSILGKIYHRNLVKLFGFCFDDDIKALVYEYMENGPLDNILFDNNHSIDWENLCHIAIETAKGVSYLHDGSPLRVIHYDIKPSNILLDSKFTPKIADFGLSKLYNRDTTHETVSDVRGTVGYIAPEIFMTSIITSKSDVYGFGMMLFEIVGRRRNWDYNISGSRECFPIQVWNKYEKEVLEEFLAEHGIEEKDRQSAKRMSMVALWCVQPEPRDRPSMSTVVKLLQGEIKVMDPPNPFQSYRYSSVSITSDSELTNAEDISESDSEYFSPMIESDSENFTPLTGKYETEMAATPEKYVVDMFGLNFFYCTFSAIILAFLISRFLFEKVA